MDYKKIASELLSSDSIKGLSDRTGVSGGDVTKVLGQALPALLNGAGGQAKDKNTSASFLSALTDHAKDDTNDLSKFLGGVDLKDGGKIIGHLLGSDKDGILKDISKSTGVSKSKTNSILSAIAPLLMSLLGKQADKEKDKGDITDLFGSLLDNVDVGDLLGGLLGGDSSSSKKSTKKSTKKNSSKKDDSGNLLTSLLKGILK